MWRDYLRPKSLPYQDSTMNKKEIKTDIIVCRYEELNDADRALVDMAKDATRRSYAPFSHFHVGAALQLANGDIVCGSNQENAAFSSGTCAERSACFFAASRNPGVAFNNLAIAAWTRDGHSDDTPREECFQAKPISPCGACRQALLEYEHLYGPIRTILYGRDEIYIVDSIRSLMPLAFTDF